MSKKTWIIGGVAVLALAGATIIGRSLNHANESKGSTGSNKVTTLKVAHTQNYVPYDFVDEKGESDGRTSWWLCCSRTSFARVEQTS